MRNPLGLITERFESLSPGVTPAQLVRYERGPGKTEVAVRLRSWARTSSVGYAYAHLEVEDPYACDRSSRW